MTSTVHIEGGFLVLATGVVQADLVVEESIIAAISTRSLRAASEDEVIDARGLVVMPGGIDPHVHVWEPGTDIEGFRAASEGAAAGGITTFFDMPLSDPPTTDLPGFEHKLRLARAGCIVDFGLWGGLVPDKLQEVPALTERGVIGFKAFLNRPRISFFTNIEDGSLLEGMALIRDAGSVIGLHAENDAILRRRKEVLELAGRRDPKSHAEWRPPIAELEGIQRSLLFAREEGVSLHIVHLSLADGAEAIWRAKKMDEDVTVETCPAYLLMDEEDLLRLGPYANSDPPIPPRTQPGQTLGSPATGHN